MKKFITEINATVPYSTKKVTISLNQQNLIITGANGSGKTALISSIYSKLNNLIRHKQHDRLPDLNNTLIYWQQQRDNLPEGSSPYEHAQGQIEHLKKEIEKIEGSPTITMVDQLEFSAQINNGSAIIELFPAVRQSFIQDARSASGINYNTKELSNESFGSQIGNQLEQHLVNLYVRRSLSITDQSNTALTEEISTWLSNFESNLKFLMEDDSTTLKFDPDSFKVTIFQQGKDPYAFQNLSSGYSSIFHVFSALLMRAAYLKTSPSNLNGVALIDEIDAHLHVALQRKILPFLSNSFPEIQFISTTHSPFVLTSVSNSVIFDITKNEQTTDMSSFSYESVLDGLFNIPPTSDILQKKIIEMVRLTDEEPKNTTSIASLINDILPNENYLDEESRFFFNKAKALLLKATSGSQ
ncbi:AAA family ATPase [Chromobacterium vaccinii]|uniref:AAA family ATPase n=1 Tax=Chromobacterium vaccinii TaxID=1108595 RepID=UPI000617EFFE|nr:AAA family ATPase [Chromobacterium vaccinii]